MEAFEALFTELPKTTWNSPSPNTGNKPDQTKHSQIRSLLFSCEYLLPIKSVTIF